MAKLPTLSDEAVKFELGKLVVTPAAIEAIENHGASVEALVARHQAGDWGQATDQTQAVNELALAQRLSLQSVYELSPRVQIVMVTNRERSATLVHLENASG